MSTPSSVTGPDRAPATDAARRAPGRRAAGDDRFGAALSAELDTRAPQDDRPQDSRTAIRDRAARHRAAQNQTEQHRAAQDQTEQHHAQERTGRHRAQERTAHDRAVGAPGTGPSADRAKPGRRRTAGGDEGPAATASAQSGAGAAVTAAGAPAAATAGDSTTAAGDGAAATSSGPDAPRVGPGTSATPGTPAPVPGESTAAAPARPDPDTTAAVGEPALEVAPGQAGNAGVTGAAQTEPGAAAQSRTGNPTAPADPPQARASATIAAAGVAQSQPNGLEPAADAATDLTDTAQDTLTGSAAPGPELTHPAWAANDATPEATSAAAQNRPADPLPVAAARDGTTGAPTAGPAEPGSPVSAAGAPAPGSAASGVPDQALGAVTGPALAAPTTAAAGPEPSAAPPAAPPAAQIAMRIVPLRLEADGVHRLTVNLHPADLGPVQVVAEIRNGDVTLQLSGSTDAGAAALRDSLDDLRRELTASGFGNCSLDLRDGGGGDQARQQFGRSHPNLSGPTGITPTPTAAPEPSPERTARTSRLDVRA